MTAPATNADEGARRRILERVRRSLGVEGETPARRAARQAALASYLGAHVRGPAPEFSQDAAELVGRFVARAQGLLSTVEELPDIEQAPAAVEAYLRRIGEASRRLYVCPALRPLRWLEAGMTASDEVSCRVSVTECLFALAETGTLLLQTSATTPVSAALLPEAHIVVVRRTQVLPGMEDVFAILRRRGPLPRGLHFISGPSRTADIDQTLVMGAHGPCKVHLLVA